MEKVFSILSTDYCRELRHTDWAVLVNKGIYVFFHARDAWIIRSDWPNLYIQVGKYAIVVKEVRPSLMRALDIFTNNRHEDAVSVERVFLHGDETHRQQRAYFEFPSSLCNTFCKGNVLSLRSRTIPIVTPCAPSDEDAFAKLMKVIYVSTMFIGVVCQPSRIFVATTFSVISTDGVYADVDVGDMEIAWTLRGVGVARAFVGGNFLNITLEHLPPRGGEIGNAYFPISVTRGTSGVFAVPDALGNPFLSLVEQYTL